MASIIKKRTIAGEVDLIDVRPLSSVPLRKKMNADDMLAAAVTAKVEDGNIVTEQLLSTNPAQDTVLGREAGHRCEGFL